MSQGTKTAAAITEAERHKRQEAVNFARANVGLEGFKPDSDVEDLSARFVNGEIDLSTFLKPALNLS